MTPENAKLKVTGKSETLRTRRVTKEELENLGPNVYVMSNDTEIELRTVNLTNKQTFEEYQK